MFKKQIFLTLVLPIAMTSHMIGQIYIAKNCTISFLSLTPVEDVAATNTAAKPLLNTATGDLQMKIPMTAFVFDKPLMQEHFNENYVESEKFPYAIFKGKLENEINFSKDGEYKAAVTGTLLIHGVEKERTIEGVITVKGSEIVLSSSFKIKFSDHGIVIPALYSGVIPPDTDVKINAQLEPYKKEVKN